MKQRSSGEAGKAGKSGKASADQGFEPKVRKAPPFEFVLDELEELQPRTNPMFGCLAIYIGERIVLILRDRPSVPADNGVWVATTAEHHESLKRELPSLRDITVLGERSTSWQTIPKSSRSFEDEVLRACALIRARDPRIGKVPKAKRKAARATAATAAQEPRARPARNGPAGQKTGSARSPKRSLLG